MSAVCAHAIGVEAPLEALLREVTFEDVCLALSSVCDAARLAGLSKPDWLPAVIVSDDDGRYGVCLNNPSHAVGAGEREALQSAVERALTLLPASEPMTYALLPDLWGRVYAAQPTFRLRTEHWRWLARLILDSLTSALTQAGLVTTNAPATPLLGRVRAGSGRNPLREFAAELEPDELVAFAEQVAEGPDALHLRLSFLVHVSALRCVREEHPWTWREIDSLLRMIESEVIGDFHLDGQAAARALRAGQWDRALQAYDL